MTGEIVLHQNDVLDILKKKVKDITINDAERLYKEKIITLIKFINDDNYFIKLKKED